jgi:hypothetical protein
MATSGQYNFNPSLGEATIYAFNLCGVRGTALLQEHMESARMAANMLLGRWSSQGVNLWQVDLQSINLNPTLTTLSASGNGTTATLTFSTNNTPIFQIGATITVAGMTPSGYNGTWTVTASAAGSVSFANATTGAQTVAGTIVGSAPAATYSVPSNTIVMLDSYVVQNTGGAAINRLILPVSRSEYASYPNPAQTGTTTTYWFDRLLSPQVTLWPVPTANQSAFNYYRVRQSQDANFTNGQTAEIPYYFLEAFTYGLAQRLAMIWAPDKTVGLKALADEAYQIAAAQNIETAQFYISPTVSSYFRA